MTSRNIQLYADQKSNFSEAQWIFIDAVFALAEKNINSGGDVIVECMTPAEIVEEFTSLDDVKEMVGLIVNRALNQRWGEDDDPQIKRAKAFENWEDS